MYIHFIRFLKASKRLLAFRVFLYLLPSVFSAGCLKFLTGIKYKYMKKYLSKIIVLMFLLGIFFSFQEVKAEEKINLYFFYSNGCPHCAKEEVFLDNIEEQYSNIEVNRYEIGGNYENAQMLARIGKEMGLRTSGVPILIIGDEAVIGYRSDETTGQEILKVLSKYNQTTCEDVVAQILGGDDDSECIHGCAADDEECRQNCGCDSDLVNSTTDDEQSIDLPFFGEVNIKSFSLPVLTVIIGALDGFNPCAMWTLLFLISLLLGMENRAKMWTLGIAFILTSGIVYFLFLTAWLNLFLFIGFIFWIRIIIGTVALGSGVYHLREYFKNKKGTCHVTDDENRKKTFLKLRNIVGQKNFLVALGGIILLAGAVNLVELVCSAGLPAIYTQVLTMANLPIWEYYGYLVLYIIIFMLDDFLIFVVAMVTLQMQGISAKYTRYSNFIGGLLMLIIGILLIFKPGWLMFG